jgi:hypothetical protein
MQISWLFDSSGARRALAAGLVGVSLLAGPAAHAQQPTKAELDKARITFGEAVALAAANNCAGALVKYKEVLKVKSTAQITFNIAECEERLGKLMEALGNYRVAASQAANDKKAVTVLKEVGSRIDAIESRLPKLTINRGKGGETATIELDGTEIGQGQLGAAMPVNPGPHVIVSRVGGKEYQRETVNLAEKETKVFDIKLDLPAPKVEKVEETKPDEPPPPPPKSRVPGIAVTVVGVAGVVVGAVGFGLRAGALSDLSSQCDSSNRCFKSQQSTVQSTIDKGRLFTGLGEVGMAVGGAGLIAGIALIATSGPQKAKAPPADSAEKEKEKASRQRPSIELVAAAPGASIGGLSLVGKF